MTAISPSFFLVIVTLVVKLVTSVSGEKNIFCNWSHRRNYISQFTEREANLCTHLVYDGATLDAASLTIRKFRKRDEDNHLERMRSLTLYTPGLKVLFKLGSYTDSKEGHKYSRLVSDPMAREKFVIDTVDFLRQHKIDGFVFEWRYPKCWQNDCSETQSKSSEPDDYLKLLQELKGAFMQSALPLTLSVAMPPLIEIGLQTFNYTEINKIVDYAFIKTNNFNGAWRPTIGHLAPYQTTIEAIMNASIEGIDRQKIIMDLPFYGRSFQLLNTEDYEVGSAAVGEGFGDNGKPTFRQICRQIVHENWNFDYIIKTENYSHDPAIFKDDQWAGFDDCNQIYEKTRFVVTNGFGGVSIWDLSNDDFDGGCFGVNFPLLRTINSAMNKRANPMNRRPKCDFNRNKGTTDRLPTLTRLTQIHMPPELTQETNYSWVAIIVSSLMVTFIGIGVSIFIIWLKCRQPKIPEEPELKPKPINLGKFQDSLIKSGNSYESLHFYEDPSSYSEPKFVVPGSLSNDYSNRDSRPCYYNDHTYLEMQNVPGR